MLSWLPTLPPVSVMSSSTHPSFFPLCIPCYLLLRPPSSASAGVSHFAMSPLSAGGGILPSFLVSTPTETSDAGAPLRGCPTVSDKRPLPRGGGGSTLRLIQSVCLGTYGLRRRCCQRHQSLPCFPGPWSCRPSCGGGPPFPSPSPSVSPPCMPWVPCPPLGYQAQLP